MSGFALLRVVAWLKRIALALEAANEREAQRAARPHSPKLTDISVASPVEWNKRWAALHETPDD